MTQPNYLFETDPRVGLPRLKPAGPSLGWSARDVEQVEQVLTARYESLAMEGAGMLTHKGRTLHVRRKAGDTSRQPTLELHAAEPSATTTVPSAPPVELTVRPATRSPDWVTGWIGGLDAALEAADGRLDEAERAMTRVVLNELADLGRAKPPAELAVVLFGAVAALAERVSHAHQPGKPNRYTFVLAGVEKLLDPVAPTPWGAPANAPGKAPPSWFARLWKGVCG